MSTVKKEDFRVKYGRRLAARKKLIVKYVNLWLRTLRLDHWDTGCDYCYHPAPLNLTSGVGATALAVWKYKQLTVTFYLVNLLEVTEPEIEYIVVHELCHAMVCEMRNGDWNDAAMEHEERVVTELAHAFVRTRTAFGKK